MRTNSLEDRSAAFYVPEQPPMLERRTRLTASADVIIQRCRLLYDRQPAAANVLSKMQSAATQLRALSQQYGEPAGDVAAITACAQRVVDLCADWATLAPKQSTPYYLGAIRDAVQSVLTEIATPLPKASKEAR